MNAIEETFEGQVLVPVCRFGVMEVYQRRDWRAWRLPKYAVFHQFTGRLLEEFRQKRRALNWAEQNKGG